MDPDSLVGGDCGGAMAVVGTVAVVRTVAVKIRCRRGCYAILRNIVHFRARDYVAA